MLGALRGERQHPGLSQCLLSCYVSLCVSVFFVGSFCVCVCPYVWVSAYVCVSVQTDLQFIGPMYLL